MTTDVPSLILAAGGEIVGKVRVQKMVYLLEQMGVGSGYSFEYRYYGPYSEDLADQIVEDAIFGRLNAETRRRQTDGVPYAVYSATHSGDGEPIDGALAQEQVRSALQEMQQQSSTVLELAATIHWLSEVEGYENWPEELVNRKGAKADLGRDKKALDLLWRLNLPPAVRV